MQLSLYFFCHALSPPSPRLQGVAGEMVGVASTQGAGLTQTLATPAPGVE